MFHPLTTGVMVNAIGSCPGGFGSILLIILILFRPVSTEAKMFRLFTDANNTQLDWQFPASAPGGFGSILLIILILFRPVSTEANRSVTC